MEKWWEAEDWSVRVHPDWSTPAENERTERFATQQVRDLFRAVLRLDRAQVSRGAWETFGEILNRGEEPKPKLKPCPFCGKADRVRELGPVQIGILRHYEVRCVRCDGVSGPECSSPERAVAAWNNRP